MSIENEVKSAVAALVADDKINPADAGEASSADMVDYISARLDEDITEDEVYSEVILAKRRLDHAKHAAGLSRNTHDKAIMADADEAVAKRFGEHLDALVLRKVVLTRLAPPQAAA